MFNHFLIVNVPLNYSVLKANCLIFPSHQLAPVLRTFSGTEVLSDDSSKGWTSEQGRYKETTWNSHTVVPTWNHVVKSPWLDFSTYIWGVGTPQNRDIGIPQNGWFIMENPINMDDSGPGRPIFGNTQSCASFGWQNGGNILRQCDVNISLQSWLIAFRCSLLMPAAVFKLHMLHYSLLIHSAHHLNTHTHT